MVETSSPDGYKNTSYWRAKPALNNAGEHHGMAAVQTSVASLQRTRFSLWTGVRRWGVYIKSIILKECLSMLISSGRSKLSQEKIFFVTNRLIAILTVYFVQGILGARLAISFS